MIRSGFFNSVNQDRKYNASDFAEYFASFISSGVFPNPSTNLQVMANNDMTVTVKPGKAWINGYILINDDDYILTLDPADGVLNRIDRIVARYDIVDREIRLEVKKGTFASSPVAPTLQRDADTYELALADIYVAKGAVSITQANITDLRFNTELCGIVKGTVDQIDTTDLFAQYQTAFNDWFQELKDVLDDNTAANLLNLINQLDDDLTSHKAESVSRKVADRRPTQYDDNTKGFKQGDIWIYENLKSEEEYEFEAYQCVDDRGGVAKWEKYVEKVAVPQKIYGVEIDESNSNPETAVVYTDDAIGFTPAMGNNGNFNWGSWENIIKDEFKIRPCVLRNLGGGNAEVNYYLDYDDYTKRADGSNSRLDGVDGDVMIEFGTPLWWKFTRVGDKLKIQLSTKVFDGAVKHAFEIEKGYNQVPIYPLFLTQIIYLLMFKNLDSQTALGKGRTDADSYTNTGTTNKKTFCYGSTDATDNVKFLGMEDYFGNRRWWIDGCYYDNNRNMLIGKGNFNDTGSGYENFGQAAPSDLGGYMDKVQGGNNTGLIPASTGGSATTYYCDYDSVSAGRLPYFGGIRSNASNAGAFSLLSTTASHSSANVGGRLFYSNGVDKIYIGAYLGVELGGALRSVSGSVSANDKTIGSFRTLAKANN